MSMLVVSVTTIQSIKPHPDPETTALDIATVLGWQCVVKKGQYHIGQKVVFFPPDTVLPNEVAERLGVSNYLSNGRVRTIKLRGEYSFGLVILPEHDWAEGENVADYYGATKYEPPVRTTAGDAEQDHPLFLPYTNLENLRNFPDILVPGELVVVTEKLHGTNCRWGSIDGEEMAGSHRLRRKRPENLMASLYWLPFIHKGVQHLLTGLQKDGHRQIIFYGEVVGPRVQTLTYGQPKPTFYVFDLLLDWKWMDYASLESLCDFYRVPMVPTLGIIRFSMEHVARMAEGTTTLMSTKSHIREGVVVAPCEERNDPRIGRVKLKYVSDTYLHKKEQGKVGDYTEL